MSLEKTKTNNKLNIAGSVSSGLNPSNIVKMFNLNDSDLKDKNISDIGGGFSNLSTYLKINYDINNSTIIDPALNGINIYGYYDCIDKGIRGLKERKEELKIEIEEQKNQTKLMGCLTQENKGQNDFEDKKQELENIENIIRDMGNDMSMFDFTLNPSSALDIRGVEDNSQDLIFMCYFLRHREGIDEKIKIIDNILKIIKDDGYVYVVGHKNYGKIFETCGFEVKHDSNAYGVKLNKSDLKKLKIKLEHYHKE